MSQQKEVRLNIRATPEQRALIERAASAKRTSLSAFMLDRSCEAAEQILSEQRHFELTPQQWDAFCAALDKPAKVIPALRALFKRPSVFVNSPVMMKQTRSSKKSKSATG
jgi:uncharacterized protein (DUF1778 family)